MANFSNSNLANFSNSNCLTIADRLRNQSELTSFSSVQIGLGIAYAVSFVIGLVGNTTTIVQIVRSQKFNTVPNIFLINLSVSQILILLGTPFTLYQVLLKRWDFGLFLCRLIPHMQTVSVLVCSFSMSMIALDRYIQIVRLSHRHMAERSTKFGAPILAVSLWIFGSLIALPIFLGFNLLENCNHNICSDPGWEKFSKEFHLVYVTCIPCLQFITPLIIMSLCNYMVLRKVNYDMMVGTGVADKSMRLKSMKRKRRVMLTLVLMVVVFICCWLPVTVFNLCRDFKVHIAALNVKNQYLVGLLVLLVALWSSILNPMLYFWLNSRHRKAMKRDWLSLTGRLRHSTSGGGRPGCHSLALLAQNAHVMFDDPFCNNELVLPDAHGKQGQLSPVPQVDRLRAIVEDRPVLSLPSTPDRDRKVHTMLNAHLASSVPKALNNNCETENSAHNRRRWYDLVFKPGSPVPVPVLGGAGHCLAGHRAQEKM